MIKAVIYDFDDVLVDSDPLHFAAWIQALKNHHVKDFSDFKDFKDKNMLGRSSRENAQSVAKHYHLNISPLDLYHEKTQLFTELVAKKIKLLPGVVSSLKLFQKIGLRLAVATGSPRQYIESTLKKFNLAKYFQVIITADEIKKGKPDPQSYQVTCQKLGLNPGECVVIEDATVGVLSAKAAGCLCIAIPNKHATNEDYSKADLILKSLEHITKNDILRLNQ